MAKTFRVHIQWVYLPINGPIQWELIDPRNILVLIPAGSLGKPHVQQQKIARKISREPDQEKVIRLINRLNRDRGYFFEDQDLISQQLELPGLDNPYPFS